MNLKNFANATALFIGLGLTAYLFVIKGYRLEFNESAAVEEEQGEEHKFERWNLKEGSITDGDTLRVVRDDEEMNIRLCGIDAPEQNQKLGIESRDYLQSQADIGKGELFIIPVEKDKQGRTVAEVYAQDSKKTAIHLNLQMVRLGYAWHYPEYSNNCLRPQDFALAEQLAREEDLGVWNGSHQPPWEWRKANK